MIVSWYSQVVSTCLWYRLNSLSGFVIVCVTHPSSFDTRRFPRQSSCNNPPVGPFIISSGGYVIRRRALRKHLARLRCISRLSITQKKRKWTYSTAIVQYSKYLEIQFGGHCISDIFTVRIECHGWRSVKVAAKQRPTKKIKENKEHTGAHWIVLTVQMGRFLPLCFFFFF
jgi:hypothetical protein